VAQMVMGGVTTTYGHDALGQLTSVAMPGRNI
jgi:YD repeat-containing protein